MSLSCAFTHASVVCVRAGGTYPVSATLCLPYVCMVHIDWLMQLMKLCLCRAVGCEVEDVFVCAWGKGGPSRDRPHHGSDQIKQQTQPYAYETAITIGSRTCCLLRKVQADNTDWVGCQRAFTGQSTQCSVHTDTSSKSLQWLANVSSQEGPEAAYLQPISCLMRLEWHRIHAAAQSTRQA